MRGRASFRAKGKKMPIKGTSNSAQTKQNNIRELLNAVREHGPISKRELQSITGLSWGAVSGLMTIIERNGYVVRLGKRGEGVGRKAYEYDINPNENLIIGGEIRLGEVIVTVTDLKGRALREYDRGYTSLDVDEVMASLNRLIETAIGDFAGRNICGIGLSLQGAVDVERGISKHISSRDPRWRNVPVKAMLEERFGLPVVLQHDPDSVYLAEKYHGDSGLRDCPDSALIRLSYSGTGMAIVLDGDNHLYSNGHFCDIAHVCVDYNGPVCPSCGKRGCLANYTVLYNVLPRYTEYCRERGLLGEKEAVTPESFIARGRMGEAAALDFWHQTGRAIGSALSTLCNLIKLDRVVVYGEMVEAKDLFADQVFESFSSHTRDTRSAEICYSLLDRRAASIGAAINYSMEYIGGLTFAD